MEDTDRAVVVIGAGGHALVATEVLREAGRHVAGWATSDGTATAPVERINLPRIGDDAVVADLLATGEHDLFVAVGNNEIRAEITRRWEVRGATFATAISPHAHVSPSATIAPGTLVMPGAVINALALIGPATIVNTGATVDHECTVGAFAHLAPRSALAGNVRVGIGAFVGIGAVVLPGRTLGDWCVVGAGAVVVADVPDQTTVIGVPARAQVVSDVRAPSVPPAVEPTGPAEPAVPEVLVVCTGNLCRSALAAALLERELDRLGIPAVVRSAGTRAPRAAVPDRRMLKAAAERGVDLSGHRSTPVTAAMIERADLILTMTAEHDAQVVAIAPSANGRTVRLRRAAWRAQAVRDRDLDFTVWVSRLSHEGPEAERPRRDVADDIDDPVGGPMRAYRAMGHEVDDLVGVLARRWQGR